MLNSVKADIFQTLFPSLTPTIVLLFPPFWHAISLGIADMPKVFFIPRQFEKVIDWNLVGIHCYNVHKSQPVLSMALFGSANMYLASLGCTKISFNQVRVTRIKGMFVYIEYIGSHGQMSSILRLLKRWGVNNTRYRWKQDLNFPRTWITKATDGYSFPIFPWLQTKPNSFLFILNQQSLITLLPKFIYFNQIYAIEHSLGLILILDALKTIFCPKSTTPSF